MEGIQFFLLVLQIIIAVVLVILVLLQKSDGDSLNGIGGGSGGLNSVVSRKASASIMTKITMGLIGIFMLNCLILASMSNIKSKSISKNLEKIANEQKINSEDSKKDYNQDSSKSGLDQPENQNNDKKIFPNKSPIVPAVE
jgi:preprotein translocase subunit SecG